MLADDRDVLKNASKISMGLAINHAKTEFEKYRIIQNRLFESDFDRLINDKKLKKKENYNGRDKYIKHRF